MILSKGLIISEILKMLTSSDLTSTTTPPLGLPCVDRLIAGLNTVTHSITMSQHLVQ